MLLRYRKPEISRPFKVPLAIGQFPLLPFLGVILNIFMLIQLTPEVMVIGIVLTVAGILVALATDRS